MNLINKDCREALKELPDESVDSCVTDPPYELGFMGKKWDASGIAYDVEVWKEVLRVLKPGGHLLSFGGTRTHHRMVCAIEDAGFEIRDEIMWVHGQGFPKSLDVSKAIDKEAGAERIDYGPNPNKVGRTVDMRGGKFIGGDKSDMENVCRITKPATDLSRQWEGFGTALKPAMEPICMARKPMVGTVAENVLNHGTGAINIDGCRIKTGEPVPINKLEEWSGFGQKERPEYSQEMNTKGRWPSNFIHDGSEEAINDLPEGASRYFYCCKPDSWERDHGITSEVSSPGECTDRKEGSAGLNNPRAGAGRSSGHKNNHPTVKPTDLMRYLVRLVTRKGGVVLDPFMGSGTTGVACKYEGMEFIGIEIDPEYFKLAEARIKNRLAQQGLF